MTRPTVSQQLTEDVRAYIRAGALDATETEQAALRAFAHLRRLTIRQAERLWVLLTFQEHAHAKQ